MGNEMNDLPSIRAYRAARWLPALTGIVVAVGLCATAAADWDDCRRETDIERTVDLSGISAVEIVAGSGTLEVSGDDGRGARELRAEGIACARTDESLAEIELEVTRSGDTLRLKTRLPRDENARLDLVVSLPNDLPLDIRDSSGSMNVADVHSLQVRDSSGSMEIERVAGPVHVISDSSGSIAIREAGEVLIEEDSSGSITVENALSLHIDEDGSGSINARDIAGDVYVGRDSSGSINVTDVGGDFTVVRDGSGGVHHDRVRGMVQLGHVDRHRD
jgi:hypothetical protein